MNSILQSILLINCLNRVNLGIGIVNSDHWLDLQNNVILEAQDNALGAGEDNSYIEYAHTPLLRANLLWYILWYPLKPLILSLDLLREKNKIWII